MVDPGCPSPPAPAAGRVVGPDAGRSAARVAAGGAAVALAWLAGVAAQLLSPDLPTRDTLWHVLLLAGLLATVTGLLMAAARRSARRAPAAPLAPAGAAPAPTPALPGWRLRCVAPFGASLALLAATLAGWAGTGLQADTRLAERLPHALEGRDLVVTGLVADLPQAGPNGLRLRFVPEAAHAVAEPETPLRLPPRMTIGWYTGWYTGWHEDAGLSAPQASLRAGQRWTFTLRLRRPHGTLNPHGYDFELQLFEQGVGATGYVRDGPVRPVMLAEAAAYPVARARQTVRDAIFQHVSDRRAAGVLAALVIGDQSAIEREDWTLFRQTGIAHLVSISGLHVTMFAWLAGALIAALWRRLPTAPLWWPAPQAARWGGLAAATAYAVFAGWGVPAQRTVAMLGMVALLASSGLRWPWVMVLLAAAVLVTALDPWALLQPGFWLSFAAVGLLMASDPAQRQAQGREPSAGRWAQARRETGQALWQGLRTQWIATLGLAPLGLVIFQQLSVVGLLANLVAIPLVTLLVTPLALLGILWSALWAPAAALVQGMVLWLSWLAGWPLAVWEVPVAPAWAQALGLLAALVAILPWPWRLRLLALPLALPLLLPQRELPAPGHFELLALDVGQGSAVLIRTRGHLLVFDAGPQYARDSDAGQRILLPLLRSLGERRVDRLVLSHRDQDHVGGARSLLTGLPVGELLSSLEPTHPLHALGVPSRRCDAGESWTWDGVDFSLLHPPPGDHARGLKPNALSCVLRVAGRAPGSGAVLLTGDIEREQELALLAAQPAALKAQVLIAPHHGSRTSSTAGFIAAVAPRVAVFQAGYRNRFGHPAPDVLARYRAQGVTTIESTVCGAWHWRGDAAVSQAVCERVRAPRHWHDRPALP